jgi:hypothetical protein
MQGASAAQVSVRPTLAQVRALRDLGLSRAERRTFFEGREAQIILPTRGGDPIYGVAQLIGNRFRSGILSMHTYEPMAGVRAFATIRNRSLAAARALGATELEMMGIAVINPKIESLLLRRGFTRTTLTAPERWGGGSVDVLSTLEPLR